MLGFLRLLTNPVGGFLRGNWASRQAFPGKLRCLSDGDGSRGRQQRLQAEAGLAREGKFSDNPTYRPRRVACHETPRTRQPYSQSSGLMRDTPMRSKNLCSTVCRSSGRPCFMSRKAAQNRKVCVRRNGRNTTANGLNSRRPPKKRKATRPSEIPHRFLSDQFSTTARRPRYGRNCCSMYACHTGLSE